jgi:hypothetical protein
MLLWAIAGVPLGSYNIVENFNIALQIQPQILTVLSLITWIQCYYYEDVSGKTQVKHEIDHILNVKQKWGLIKCCTVAGAIGAIFGGVEIALVSGLKVLRLVKLVVTSAKIGRLLFAPNNIGQ